MTGLNHENTHCADYSEDCPKECYRGRLVRDLAGVPVNKVRWAFLKGTEECKEICASYGTKVNISGATALGKH